MHKSLGIWEKFPPAREAVTGTMGVFFTNTFVWLKFPGHLAGEFGTADACGSVEVYDAAAQRRSRGLGAISHTQFAEHTADVKFHRDFTDEKLRGDFFVAAAAHD